MRLLEPAARSALKDALKPRLKRFAKANTEDALSYVEMARELLTPISNAVDGRSPPPLLKPRRTRMTPAQAEAVEKATRLLPDSVADGCDPGDVLH